MLAHLPPSPFTLSPPGRGQGEGAVAKYGGVSHLRIDVWGQATPPTPYMGPRACIYQLYGELTDRAGGRDAAAHDDHERSGRVLRAGLEWPRRRPPDDLHGRGVRVRQRLRPRGLRRPARRPRGGAPRLRADLRGVPRRAVRGHPPRGGGRSRGLGVALRGDHPRRSEEHTSELQSRRDLVCRLLLEKKKKTTYQSFTGNIIIT